MVINNHDDEAKTSTRASPRREEGGKFSAHAPGGELHALVGDQLGPADGAVELELIEPSVEAALVEHVAARQPPHAVPFPQPAQAHHAAVGAFAGEPIGEEPVEVELLGEDDQAGEAGAEGGGEARGVVGGGGEVGVGIGGVGAGEAEGAEEGGEGGAEVVDAGGEEGEEEEGDGIGGDVVQLAL